MTTPTGHGLTVALDGPFHEIKNHWRSTITADDVVRDPSLPLPEARAWALEHLIDIANRGYAVAGFPGHGGTVAESVAHFEMMALGDLSLNIKSGVQHGLFGGAITNLGTSWHHEMFIDDLISCELTGCFAMTELGHGSDVSSVETTITYRPESDEYEINSPTPSATKAYIGNAGQDGKMAVVFGQLLVGKDNHGVHAVLVPIRNNNLEDLPGVTTGDHGHKGGLLGVDNGLLTFDHVRVPRRMLLNRYGGVGDDGVYTSPIESKNARFFTMLGTLVRGRICVGSGAAMATRKALSIATRYSLQRKQFRKPGMGQEVTLLDYQTHQRKLLPNIAKAYAYGFAVNEVSQHLQRVSEASGEDPSKARELETRAAGLKAVLTRWANDTIQVCREACGGAGYMSENGITLIRQDADIFATFEGDNTVLLQLVAKALLVDYKKTWGDMDMRGTAQATAKLLGGRFMERTTAGSTISRLVSNAKLKPESERLHARGWQVEMFEFREQHLVETLARRMRAAAKAPEDKIFDAVNECQEHMLEAARAHTDRTVLEAFVDGISQCHDEYIRALLIKICDLYALATIEENRAWFMEHNRIDGARSKAISTAVDALNLQLRGKAMELVEGLGVPVEWLGSAMLRDAGGQNISAEGVKLYSLRDGQPAI
ncbi:MAG: acyl-CoA dehydrogenase [Propionibacteriaceae bacterium]|nr:acyl-CoA dehydrogenase [Propionibacteriaceae bacterium]